MRLPSIKSSYAAAATLIGLSIVITVYLAARGSSQRPPSPAEAAALTILAGAFQILGAASISKQGRADPGHARSAVRRLLGIGIKAQKAELLAQSAYEKGNASIRREGLGQVSVALSYIQEETAAAIEDWNHIHADALRDLLRPTATDAEAARPVEGVRRA